MFTVEQHPYCPLFAFSSTGIAAHDAVQNVLEDSSARLTTKATETMHMLGEVRCAYQW